MARVSAASCCKWLGLMIKFGLVLLCLTFFGGGGGTGTLQDLFCRSANSGGGMC